MSVNAAAGWPISLPLRDGRGGDGARAFSSGNSSFYPRCPIFFWLHLSCPGCGGTRALAALLHGRLKEAMHWNAMMVVFFLLPLSSWRLTYWRAMKAGLSVAADAGLAASLAIPWR